MKNYKDLRIQALETEVKRLTQMIEQRDKNKPGFITDLNDPVFARRLRDIEVNYEHETGKP